MARQCNGADDRCLRGAAGHRRTGPDVDQRAAQPHDDRAESVALVPDIVEHDDSRQQRTPDHRNEAEWNHQNDARCEQTEADP